MEEKKQFGLGWRKVLMMLLGLTSFTLIILVLQLKEAAPIVAVGSQVALITGAGLFANVKSNTSIQTTGQTTGVVK